MRGDTLVQNQRLMAQSVFALADQLENSVGIQLGQITFAKLPTAPKLGMLCCITDSTVSAWGAIIAGGGSNVVLGFYDGAHWVVK
jgi:hypothetical protein